jgi:tetratricopeptide (TPR) repeat protein
MTEVSQRPFVGRVEALQTLSGLLPAPGDGPRAVLLAGGEGSGRTRLASQLEQDLGERLVIRWRFEDTDDGVAALLRLHGGLAASLARGGERAREMAAGVRAAQGRDPRLDTWIQQFLDQLEAGQRDDQGGLQIRLPKDNPYWGLLGLLLEIPRQVPTVLVFHQVNAVCSPAFWTWLGLLWREVQRRELPVLWVLSTTESPYGDGADDPLPTPSGMLMQLLDGKVDATVGLEPLTEEEVQELLDESYRPHEFPEGFASHLRRLTDGDPALLTDLLDLLEGEEVVVWGQSDGFTLTRSLAELTLEELVPAPDPGPGEDEDLDPAQRSEWAETALYAASQVGERFTASAVARAMGVEQDIVDDILDDLPQLVTEQNFHEPVGTWIYSFNRPLYRRRLAQVSPRLRKKVRSLPGKMARVLLETHVPAAYTFIPDAARLLVAGGQARRARNLLSLAMGTDRIDLSRFAMEMVDLEGGDELWPGLMRLLHAEPAERACASAQTELANEMIDRLQRWAERSDDAGLRAYTSLLRSRMALRERDMETARTHAEAALEGFQACGESVREGETLNQLAILALHGGDPRAAKEYVDQATRAANIPPVKAHAMFIRGLLRKGQRKLSAAAESFGEAARLAGDSGNPLLGVEARINQGELWIAQARPKSALTPLREARATAQAMQARLLERAAASLLAQAEAATGNAKEAYDLARDALELNRHLNLDRILAADLYHCGLFAAGAQDPGAARTYLEQARGAALEDDIPLRKEICFHLGQMHMVAGELDDADRSLGEALELANKLGDGSRVARILQAQGMVQEKRGDVPAATALYREAMEAMTHPGQQREKEAIRRHLAEIEDN